MSKFFTFASAAAAVFATSLSAQAVIETSSDAAVAATSGTNNMQNQGSGGRDPCACWEPGMALPNKKCLPAAYNASASIEVKCGWDLNVFGSFIYWDVEQDNMDMAYVTPTQGTLLTAVPGAVAYPDTKYKPGFKVGVGFDTDFDDWAAWAEYTWLHTRTTSSAVAPALGTGALGSWTGSDWFSVGTNVGNVVTSSWKMNFDMVDLNFSRPYYQGTKLTVAPYGGLRAMWIRQNYTVGLVTPAGIGATSHNKSHSWGIGADGGLMTHWMMGYGFRFEGKTGASLLYTRYTKIAHAEVDQATYAAAVAAQGSTTNLGTLRPTMDMGLGLGWGMYSNCQKYYFDLAARYDFMLLWDQNVMRGFAGSLAGGYVDQSGSLNMHGLTVTARMDF